MSDKLRLLLESQKISRREFETYILFQSEVGQNWLKERLEGIVMEEPPEPKPVLFAWHDGRRSCFRDIVIIINRVDRLLEELEHD